jgi:hypothetical protein
LQGALIKTARWIAGTALVLLNLFAFLVLVLGADGCTKCPINSDAERWAMVSETLMISAVPFAANLLFFMVLGFRFRRNRVRLYRFVALVVATTATFAGVVCMFIAVNLRCGKDCLPRHPASNTFDDVSSVLMLLGFVGTILTWIWLSRAPRNAGET